MDRETVEEIKRSFDAVIEELRSELRPAVERILADAERERGRAQSHEEVARGANRARPAT
jgi:hypothetical protein